MYRRKAGKKLSAFLIEILFPKKYNMRYREE